MDYKINKLKKNKNSPPTDRQAKFKIQNSNEGGFSLLEAMLSIFILLMGITAAMSLVSGGVRGLTLSKNRLIATNLAQEGLEIIHNVRDNNWLNSKNEPTPPPWNDWTGSGSATGCPKVTPCTGYVYWSSNDLIAQPEPSLLKWNAITNHYAYDGAVGVAFSRIITIVDDPDGEGVPTVRVQATVGWGDAGSCTIGGVNSSKQYCIQVEERLYKWR